MFKKILFSITILSLFSFPALAQEGDSSDPGLLPDSPFYFIKVWAEDIGTFFTFGDLAKAERYQELAEKRIAEAEALAEKEGSGEAMERVMNRYQNQLEKSLEKVEAVRERNRENERERVNQITEKVARNTAKHFSVLEEMADEVSEEAETGILRAKNASSDSQIRALKVLFDEKPEETIEIFSEAIENRLNKIRTDAEEEAVEEYEKYSNFGQEISEMAKGIRIGETTVPELVEKATSHHLEVLERVRNQVNEQAREKIEDAIQTRERNKERNEEQIRTEEGSLDKGEKERNEEQVRTEEASDGDENDKANMGEEKARGNN